MTALSGLIWYFAIIVPSAIIHEYAHGWAADMLGDPTARNQGRLTLDPRAHIDPLNTLVLPVLLYVGTGGAFLFAAAKPVPYNPYNLRNMRWGSALVAAAGPLVNLATACGAALVARLAGDTLFGSMMVLIVLSNVMLAVFNAIPIPPLDGSKILYALIPRAVLPRLEPFFEWGERMGVILVLGFVFFIGSSWIGSATWWISRLLVGASG